MKTTVTELPESKVKIDVAVEPDAVAKRVDRAAKAFAGEMKMPGFRKGKVPPQMVIQRIGREAVVEQALRDSLPEWYERALLDAGINAIGDPQVDLGDLPGEGEELAFSIEVFVRPKAELGEYRGLEVGRAEAEVPDEAVDSELERLREGFASLSPVDRPAASGDALLIDFEGRVDGEKFEGGEAKDFLVELGASGLLPEFDTALAGAARARSSTSSSRSRTSTSPPSWRARTPSSTSSSRRSGRRTSPSSTTSSHPRPRSSRPWPSSPTTSAAGSPRRSSAGPTPSSASARSTSPPGRRSSSFRRS